MKKILATIDDSGLSEEILPVVMSLAKDLAAQVILLTVVPLPAATSGGSRAAARATPDIAGGSPNEQVGVVLQPAEQTWLENPDQALEHARSDAMDSLSKAAASMRESGIDVVLEVAVSGDPAKAIVESAAKNAVDFVAMCTHGRSGLSRMVQGSIASAVINSGVAPMLILRPKGVA